MTDFSFLGGLIYIFNCGLPFTNAGGPMISFSHLCLQLVHLHLAEMAQRSYFVQQSITVGY